jgi:AcrR family transcriptional regulator
MATEARELEEVRERIFQSALENFSRKGYAATSLREIAEDARTTKPMIYYYFGSKEGLYTSIVGEILQEMGQAIDRAVPREGDVLVRARKFCESYLSYFAEHEDVIALVLREVFGLGGDVFHEFARELGDQLYRQTSHIVSEGVLSGVFRDCQPGLCAAAIHGIMNNFILAHVFAGEELNQQAAVSQVMDVYFRGLLKDQAVGQ